MRWVWGYLEAKTWGFIRKVCDSKSVWNSLSNWLRTVLFSHFSVRCFDCDVSFGLLYENSSQLWQNRFLYSHYSTCSFSIFLFLLHGKKNIMSCLTCLGLVKWLFFVSKGKRDRWATCPIQPPAFLDPSHSTATTKKSYSN